MTVVLHCIAPDQIDATWPLLEPFFASTCIAVPTTNVKPDWLRRRAEERHALLWAVSSAGELLAAFATELWADDLCWILSLAGRDMARWFDPVILELADLAKRRGAKRLGFEGRRGWVRPAHRLGFALTKTIDLPNGRKLVRMEKAL